MLHWSDRGGKIELEGLSWFEFEFGKSVERAQAERLQEERRRFVLHRASDDVFTARLRDETAIEQRPDDAIGVHAAYRLDLAARHRLDVRYDCQRFERRRRERRFRRKQIGFDDRAGQRRGRTTISAGDLA